MIPWEEVKKYLPQYLSAESTIALLEELEQFPENIDSRIYTTQILNQDVIFQGDVITDLPIVNLPAPTIHYAPCMILSNTCDNQPKETRYISRNLIYAPIVKLKKIIILLEANGIDNSKIETFVATVRKQYVTQLFYLPNGYGIEDESIVFLDRINSSDNTMIGKNLKDIRILCLSDYGFYLLLFKLSVHFTRIQEKVDRNKGIIN